MSRRHLLALPLLAVVPSAPPDGIGAAFDDHVETTRQMIGSLVSLGVLIARGTGP